MKVFISQPMKDKTDEEIEKERKAMVLRAQTMADDVEIIDSYFKDAPHDAKPLWFLGKSLELLSAADMALFATGWEDARGCKIEHECCKEYGIRTIEF